MTVPVAPKVSDIHTSRIRLREVLPGDYLFLYSLATNPEHGFRWRFRNTIPSFEEFVGNLRAPGMLVQLLIVSATTNEPLGIVICYQADFRNRHAYIAVQGRPDITGRGVVAEAAQVFIRYLFGCYDFEKLHAESYEFSLTSFGSVLNELFVEEGRLKNHERYLGRQWDLSIIAVYRNAWERFQVAQIEREAAPTRMSFEEFAMCLSEECDLPLSEISETALLHEDLGCDSFAMLEILVLLESSSAPIPIAALLKIRTVGDLHFQYLQAGERSDSDSTDLGAAH